MKDLKGLLENEIVKIAKLPAKNYSNINLLDELEGYTVPLISHDYAAKTPVMWNTLYERLGLRVRNIMVVADPKNVKIILDALRADPQYLGGGAGVGFKEVIRPYLDEVRPVDLKSVNIIVKEDGRLIGYNTDAEGFVRSLEEKLHEIGKSLEGANLVIFGAGGVAKEVIRLLVERKARRIAIVNRTVSKATEIAYEFRDATYAVPETMIRGTVLNSRDIPIAIINLTDKGSDGRLEQYSAFAEVTDNFGDNITISRDILRYLAKLNPDIVIADIVLTKNERSITLRLADAEGLKHLIDGKPMVVYQAVPAYDYMQKAHPQVHKRQIQLEDILRTFKEAAGLK